jgi:thiamine-monophosphate kinase
VARRLRDLGEHAWIARLTRRLPVGRRTLLGPGDDAAVLRPGRRPLVVTTDTLVEGVHFRLGWESPSALGRRAYRVNLSDVAAMGATPLAVLVAIAAPPDLPVATLDGIMRGIAADARRSGADVVGGNLTSASHLAITITLLGEATGRVVTRAGARAGDAIWVTGRLGDAATAVSRLAGGGSGRPPVPVRVVAGRLLAPIASAMIDVSDGLLQDLGHVCRASGVRADVAAASLPIAPACRTRFGDDAIRIAATGGEDYELLFTVPAPRAAVLRRVASRLGCRVTPIGAMAAGRPAVRLHDADDRVLPLGRAGFDHFAR